MRGPDAKPETLSTLCDGWKMFYEHTIERFEKLANEINREMNNR